MSVAAPAIAPPARSKPKSKKGRLILVAIAPVLVLGMLYGLAKAGVLPVGKWAGKNPAALKALTALGLSPKKAVPVVAAKKPVAAPPAAPLLPSAPSPLPAVAALPSKREPPKDNTGRVARILSSMEPAQVARLMARMPDPEVAPLLLKMKEGTAGEILSALPPVRAATLTRYLRRYQAR